MFIAVVLVPVAVAVDPEIVTDWPSVNADKAVEVVGTVTVNPGEVVPPAVKNLKFEDLFLKSKDVDTVLSNR